MISQEQQDLYFDNILIPHFISQVDRHIYSMLIGRDLRVRICSNLTAQSVGFSSYHEVVGKSFLDYRNPEMCVKVFGAAYDSEHKQQIDRHIENILDLQYSVLDTGAVRCFIDVLPYQNNLRAWLTTYVPIYHPDGDIIGIHAISVATKFLRFQDFIGDPLEDYELLDIKLTKREHEIIFLVANGIVQEQIGQILGISRSTVATVIASLCIKFGIDGYSAKLLARKAIYYGYYKHIPSSLLQPCIITVDDDNPNVVL